MRKSLLSALAQICWKSGLLKGFEWVSQKAHLQRGTNGRPAFPYVGLRSAPNFQILTFHRVCSRSDPFFPGIPVNILARQLEFLAARYTVIDLAEILSRLDDGAPIPQNGVVLTFDDGYRDNYELAFPILRRLGLPATIFLTTSFVNGEDIPWNDKIYCALKNTHRREMAVTLENGRHRFELASSHQRLRAAAEILNYLFGVRHSHKLTFISEFLDQLEIHEFGELRRSMLKWDQVREMSHQGIQFGAHTVSHPVLSRLPESEAADEIVQSKRTIEVQLGRPVDLFAYPVGRTYDFNQKVKMLVKRAGFRGAVTTIFGTNTQSTDRFELHRGGADQTDLAAFASRHCWYKFSR